MKMYLNTIEMIMAHNIIILLSKKVLMHYVGYKILLKGKPNATKTNSIKSERDIVAPIDPNIIIL